MAIVESASRLFELMAARDSTFTKYLTTGTPVEEIERITAPTGRSLPEEVVTFYNRFGLPKGYQYSSDKPTFFGIYWLLGLEDAVAQLTTIQAELWEEFYPEKDFPGSSGWFPLLQEDANFYLLDTAQTNEGKCPVASLSEYGDLTTKFVSLEAMFDALHAWVKDGVLTMENGHIVGDYEGDKHRVAQIAAPFNPGLEHWAS